MSNITLKLFLLTGAILAGVAIEDDGSECQDNDYENGGSIIAATECQSRDYKNGGTVCVCNATYCDFIPPVEKVNSLNYLVYTSNKAGLRFQRKQGQFKSIGDTAINAIHVGTDLNQEIVGFGGAFTDAAGINIRLLGIEAQQNLLRSYFGKDGIEYTIGRVPIGCTDFSTRGYSYDDSASEDPQLINFDLAPEDYAYKIPIIKAANDLTNGTLKLIGVAWTSPKWMKVIPKYVTIFGELKREMFQPFADYHLKFLEAYDENNINFWAISTVNQPSVGYIPKNIPTVAFTAPLLSNWVANNFGPTIRNSNYSNTKILTLEDQRTFLPWFLEEMFKNSATRNYVDGVAVHWYFDKLSPVSVLDEFHRKFPDIFLIGTEACRGNGLFEKDVLLGSWQRAEDYAVGIIENLKHWFTGWVDWNLVLDETGGPSYTNNFVDAPIITNATAGEFYKQPTFYAMGHFSKFVPPGSKRIDVSEFNANYPTIGFKRPDGGIVIIILNKNDEDINVSLIDKTVGQIDVFLSQRSITTLLYW